MKKVAEQPLNNRSFKLKAKKALRRNRHYLTRLENNPPANLTKEVNKLHKEVFAETDCLNCGNCCKSQRAVFTPKDLKRITAHFKMTKQEFIDKYKLELEEGDWCLPKPPCPLLLPDNKCSIYEIRPECCRGYPHTDKKNFKLQLNVTRDNVETCPAVFKIVERMRETISPKK